MAESDIVPLAFALARSLDCNPTFRYVFEDPDLFEQDVVALLSAQMVAARRSAPAAAAFCGGDPSGAVFFYRAPGAIAMDPVVLRTPGVRERSLELAEAYRWMMPSSPHLLLQLIGVDPPGQRQGLGSALLAVAFSYADQHSVPVLTVTAHAEAAEWLVLKGFAPVGATVSGKPDLPVQTVFRREPTSKAELKSPAVA